MCTGNVSEIPMREQLNKSFHLKIYDILKAKCTSYKSQNKSSIKYKNQNKSSIKYKNQNKSSIKYKNQNRNRNQWMNISEIPMREQLNKSFHLKIYDILKAKCTSYKSQNKSSIKYKNQNRNRNQWMNSQHHMN